MKEEGWEKRLENLILSRKGIVYIPSNTKFLSQHFGTLRHENNLKRGINKNGTDRTRGNSESSIAKSIKDNVQGMIAEIIGHFIFDKEEIPYIHSALFSEDIDSNPDISAGKYTFDVKSVTSKFPVLRVKDFYLYKKKNITHYLFIHVETGQYWIFPFHEIRQWDLKVVKNWWGKYYWLPVEDIDNFKPTEVWWDDI